MKTVERELKIAIVGHLVNDEIIYANGKTKSALGGTAYNLAALAAVAERTKILPVCRVGLDAWEQMRALFGRWPSVDFANVNYCDRDNVVHRLTYRADGSREEWNSTRQHPLSLRKVPDDADALILNFISGRDVVSADLRAFRSGFNGLIYLDIHSLVLGLDSRMIRFLRPHRSWQAYVSCADMLQMNAAELGALVGYEIRDFVEIASACKSIHKCGPRLIVVTMGKEGLLLSQGKQVYHLPPVEISRAIDSTGCGDTLGAAFVYEYLRSDDALRSIEAANRYAAAKATFSGLEGFANLDRILKRIGKSTKAREIVVGKSGRT
jgi:sugar/nucleoside kinase (ribokinase family)